MQFKGIIQDLKCIDDSFDYVFDQDLHEWWVFQHGKPLFRCVTEEGLPLEPCDATNFVALDHWRYQQNPKRFMTEHINSERKARHKEVLDAREETRLSARETLLWYWNKRIAPHVGACNWDRAAAGEAIRNDPQFKRRHDIRMGYAPDRFGK